MCLLIVICSFPSHVDFRITQKYSCIRLFHILSCVSGGPRAHLPQAYGGLGHPGTSIPQALWLSPL